MKKLLPLLLLLAGCEPKADTPLTTQSPTTVTQTEPRVTIIRIGVFNDDLAYDGKRGIYLIKDNKTGKDFIGVSGVGISELGDHLAYKHFESDER